MKLSKCTSSSLNSLLSILVRIHSTCRYALSNLISLYYLYFSPTLLAEYAYVLAVGVSIYCSGCGDVPDTALVPNTSSGTWTIRH